MEIRVPEKAVVKRLQRFLLANGKHLLRADSRRQKRLGLGRYYLRDAKDIINKDVDIEKLARELTLLDAWLLRVD